MATDPIPALCRQRSTRQAISPRLAMRTFLIGLLLTMATVRPPASLSGKVASYSVRLNGRISEGAYRPDAAARCVGPTGAGMVADCARPSPARPYAPWPWLKFAMERSLAL